jgi:hypothetical protein
MPEPLTAATGTLILTGAAVPMLTIAGVSLGVRADILLAGFLGAVAALALLNTVPAKDDTWCELSAPAFGVSVWLWPVALSLHTSRRFTSTNMPHSRSCWAMHSASAPARKRLWMSGSTAKPKRNCRLCLAKNRRPGNDTTTRRSQFHSARRPAYCRSAVRFHRRVRGPEQAAPHGRVCARHPVMAAHRCLAKDPGLALPGCRRCRRPCRADLPARSAKAA